MRYRRRRRVGGCFRYGGQGRPFWQVNFWSVKWKECESSWRNPVAAEATVKANSLRQVPGRGRGEHEEPSLAWEQRGLEAPKESTAGRAKAMTALQSVLWESPRGAYLRRVERKSRGFFVWLQRIVLSCKGPLLYSISFVSPWPLTWASPLIILNILLIVHADSLPLTNLPGKA